MKSHLNLIMLIFTIILITSCDKDENPISPNDNEGFIYPLKIGNQWEYSRTFSNINSRPDSLMIDTTIPSTAVITIIKKEIIQDSITTYLFHESLTENNQIFTDDTYYANLDSGLYFYAYYGSGHVIPKLSSNNKILFKGNYFNSIKEITNYIVKAIPSNYMIVDSLIYEIPPLQSLKYPLEIGSQWIYRYPHKPWHIDKKIISNETIEVTAGCYECYKIQWLYDINQDDVWDDDIIFYDYLCEEGLIKRSILFKDLQLIVGPEPEPIGLFDSKDEYVLTKVILK